MKYAELIGGAGTAGGLLKPIGKKLIAKGSVAAGKAAKADFGVIGLSIGQEQSTGDTSKPAVPMAKYKTIPGNKQGAL